MLPSFFLSYTSAFLTGMFAGLYAFFGLPAVIGPTSPIIPLFVATYIGYFCSNISMYLLGRFSAHGLARLFSFFHIHTQSTKKAKELLSGKNFFFFSLIIPFFLDSVIYFTCGLLRMKAWKFIPTILFVNLLHATILTFFGKKTYDVLIQFTNHPKLASFFIMASISLLLLRNLQKK